MFFIDPQQKKAELESMLKDKVWRQHLTITIGTVHKIGLCQDNKFKFSRLYLKEHGYEMFTIPWFFLGHPVYIYLCHVTYMINSTYIKIASYDVVRYDRKLLQ